MLYTSSHHIIHHWAAVVFRGCVALTLPCHRVALSSARSCIQYVSRSSLHRLAGCSPTSSFLVEWSLSGDTRGPSVVFEAAYVFCPDYLFFLTLFIISITYLYALSEPEVGPSVLVCDVEPSSFQFRLGSRKFVLCLFGGPRIARGLNAW